MTLYPYPPNHTVVPGEIVFEHMALLGMNQAELGRRSGRLAKPISAIVSGKALWEPETALQFERVLGSERAHPAEPRSILPPVADTQGGSTGGTAPGIVVGQSQYE